MSYSNLIDTENDLAILLLVSSVETEPSRGVCLMNPRRFVPRFQVLLERPLHHTYGLHSVPLGSAEDVVLNEPLLVFGFPLAGQESVTLSQSTCSGIVSDEQGQVSQIKMHTRVDNGFSGGPVVSLHRARSGRLVGILSHTLGQIDFAKPIDALRPCLEIADQFINGQRAMPSSASRPTIGRRS